jgi:transcriptional regulator with XRE-family HTH domain
MVEFGEQLRRAREAKGMTQQSLAEQLYVTRQSVSRWECGDRYPDLITTTKIAQILEVSLDDLLSGKEMEKVVERNPVIENKVANNVMIALYSVVLLFLIVPIFDQLLRLPGMKEPIGDIFRIAGTDLAMIGVAIQVICFSFGLINAIIGCLSPKRMGTVLVGYFMAKCLSTIRILPEGFTFNGTVQSGTVALCVISMLPNIIGAVAVFCYFIKGYKIPVWPALIILAAVFGILGTVLTSITLLRNYSDYYTMSQTVGLILNVAVYGLIIYQTITLLLKRKSLKKEEN